MNIDWATFFVSVTFSYLLVVVTFPFLAFSLSISVSKLRALGRRGGEKPLK